MDTPAPLTARSTFATLRAQVTDHPFKAVAGAFVLGAFTAYEQPRLPRNRIARSAFAMVGAIAVRAARIVVARQLMEAARSLWAPPAAPSHGAS